MDFLPKEIEDIIMDYKDDLESNFIFAYDRVYYFKKIKGTEEYIKSGINKGLIKCCKVELQNNKWEPMKGTEEYNEMVMDHLSFLRLKRNICLRKEVSKREKKRIEENYRKRKDKIINQHIRKISYSYRKGVRKIMIHWDNSHLPIEEYQL